MVEIFMYDWIPAISTTSLLAGALWLGRNLIATRLTGSVKHEYDVKIENLRNEINKKSTQIEALRNGALSGIVNRQSILYQRQVEAIDRLWSGVVQMAPAKNIATTVAVFNFEVMSERAAEDPRLRKPFEIMGNKFDQNCLITPDANKSRPYISRIAWALFSAYQAILGHYVMKMFLIQEGLNEPSILDYEKVTKVIKAALPHQTENLDKFGHQMFHLFLDEIENLLLVEFEKILQGSKASEDSVKQASSILNAVDELETKDESGD